MENNRITLRFRCETLGFDVQIDKPQKMIHPYFPKILDAENCWFSTCLIVVLYVHDVSPVYVTALKDRRTIGLTQDFDAKP